jgi:hypothetical protein
MQAFITEHVWLRTSWGQTKNIRFSEFLNWEPKGVLAQTGSASKEPNDFVASFFPPVTTP